MATLVLRGVKGTFLTHTEVDNNFTNLNTGKLETSNNLSDLTNTATARSNLGANNASNLTTGTVAPARLGSGTADNTKFLRGDNTWQEVPIPTGLTSGSTDIGFLRYAGTTKTSGQIYGGTTAPDATTRLNYDGYLYSTRFYGDGSFLTNLTPSNINGQVASALVAGTVTAAAQPNITSLGTLTSLDVAGGSLLQQTQERFTALTGSTGAVTHNFSSGGVFIHSSITDNFTANVTNLPSSVGRTSIVTLILQQGATARLCTGLSVNGNSVTVRWLGGTVPTPTSNAVDVQVFTIFQTGASTYLVLGQLGTYN